MTRTLILVATLATLALSSTVEAQTLTKLGPGQGLAFSWPEPAVDADGLDAPDGYRVKATSVATNGVLETWEVTNRELALTYAQLPAGAFTVTVHPFNVAGEAGPSNVTGPFGKAAIPKPLTGVVAGVTP
jgi:uncharacterized protein (DUF2141 family)